MFFYKPRYLWFGTCFIILFALVSCSIPKNNKTPSSSTSPTIQGNSTLIPTLPKTTTSNSAFPINLTPSPSYTVTESKSNQANPLLTPSRTPSPLRLITVNPYIPVIQARFAVVDYYNKRNIGIFDYSKQEVRELVSDLICSNVSWSPDGQWLAMSAVIQQDDNYDIYIIDPDNGKTRKLTTPPHAKVDIAWSPDGKSIVYVEEGEPNDLAIVDVESGYARKLTYTAAYEYAPTWSPDGEKIAFLSSPERDLSNFTLWIISADGSNMSQVSDIQVGHEYISWAPDGKSIAFATDYHCGDIFSINVDGSNLQQLTETRGCANQPVWSPNGKQIAFLGSEVRTNVWHQVNWQIYIMNSDGSNIVPVTQEDVNPRFFSWSPVPSLELGKTYYITKVGANLDLHQEPSLSSPLLKQIQEGEVVSVLEGPVDEDDYYWWQLRTDDGTEGWAVEFFGWYQEIE